RFIYVHRSSIYGNQKILPLKESLSPNPQNPYALQKLIGEYYCKMYADLYTVPIIVFRLFNVYGSRMFSKGSYKLVFTKWLEQIKNKEPLTIFGSGKQTRDFTYISDVVDGLIKGMNINNKIIFETFNLGYGRQVEVNYLAKLFNHPSQHFPGRQYEEKFKQADIQKAKKMLNWEPKISIEEGVQKLLNDYISTIHLTNR
ncbi:MAG: GDP-mannose 4,6-dehydratase, partial [Actinobacteria bacterium]|nr:GDP-mannose 4,6-dehydratase [Actinomycetota bacterium]